MNELLANATAFALARPIAGDAMAYRVETAELLDVDVDHVAGMVALVATRRPGRLQIADAVQSNCEACGRAPTHPDLRHGLSRHERTDGNPCPSVSSRLQTSASWANTAAVGGASPMYYPLRAARILSIHFRSLVTQEFLFQNVAD